MKYLPDAKLKNATKNRKEIKDDDVKQYYR